MKKIFYIVLLAVVGMTMYSCSDDYETYAEQRDYELSHLSSFVNNPSLGEIKGKKINVISEEQFLANDTVTDVSKNEFVLFEDGVYTSKEDVARYISEFGHLPQNFITKKEAQALGWPGGSLEKYAPGKCIGGDRFGNYEGLLPEEKGRKYYECDIDTLGKDKRGAKRIIYSNDGLVYYTGDHYETFELLYGEE